MGSTIVVESNAQVPLLLSVAREGEGGATGLTPLVAVRNALVAGSYLDWDDSTFKTSGWGTKYEELSMFDAGHYQRVLDLAPFDLPAGTMLVAEYQVVDGSEEGIDSDIIVVQKVGQDTALVRKAITNRQEEFGGDPGQLILFDDDATTPILIQPLRDGAGNGIALAVNVPAKRGASSI